MAFVGKGITYDSGGLTIKPGSSMATMKYDMGGAAAVIAATFAIAELGLPVAVTTYAPMAENMASGNAMRPGDVLTMYDGQTVEVTNTDAEGRLILADAIAMAAEGDHDSIIDAATLTGPCIVALGEKVSGLFGDDGTIAAVAAAAGTSGEMLWRLPIPDETATPSAGEQDRRRPPAQLGALGLGPVRGRVPRASSSATSRGRTSTSPDRPGTPAAPGATSLGGDGLRHLDARGLRRGARRRRL